MPRIEDYYDEQSKESEIREITRRQLERDAKRILDSYSGKVEIKQFLKSVYIYLRG